MIKRFEVGKRYRFTGKEGGIDWANTHAKVLEGKPHLCVKAGDSLHPHYALFDGMQPQLTRYQDGMWDWTCGFGSWEEVTQFQRGDKVIVWDSEGGAEHTRDFVAYAEGAYMPYIVSTDITQELFLLNTYRYCKPEDSKLKELIALLDTAQVMYTRAELALQDASEKYDAYKKEH